MPNFAILIIDYFFVPYFLIIGYFIFDSNYKIPEAKFNNNKLIYFYIYVKAILSPLSPNPQTIILIPRFLPLLRHIKLLLSALSDDYE